MRSLGVAIALLSPALALAQDPAAKPPDRSSPFRAEQVSGVPWRNVGPANMSGRLTDIAIAPGNGSTWYVGSAGGGLWKTTNAGTTWKPVFEHYPTASIGDVAVAPSDADVVWVGTGEENARNSVQWGDGVYKSTDGGKTFHHMGLAETFQIGRIAIHPRDPAIVYVAALGSLWGANAERGVYRTLDGGKTWRRVLYLDDKTGCIDVRIDPQHPDVVYAAMYERHRDQFDGNDPAVRFGNKAGLFRSDDGGETWKRLMRGLPTCKWGRSGLCLWQKNPDTVFAIIETERSGWASGDSRSTPPPGVSGAAGGPPSLESLGLALDDADGPAELGEIPAGTPAASAGLRRGDRIVRWGDTEIDGAEELVAALRGALGRQIALVVARGDDEVELTLRMPRPTTAARTRRGTAYMGVMGEDGDGGARLTAVTEGGPSAQAGLRAGDEVVAIDDHAVGSWRELVTVIRRSAGGQKVAVSVRRGGEKKKLALTYGTRGGGPGGRPGGGGAPHAGRLGGQNANVQDRQGEHGYETGGVFRSDDRGETWHRLNSLTERPFYYSQIAVDPQDDQHIYTVGTTFWASHDGGKKFEAANRDIHVDFHLLWVDPRDGEHILLGGDGGLHQTFDRAHSWDVLNNLPVAQFYHAAVDSSVPYRIYGGLQDNGTWGGPSRTRWREGITPFDWVQIYGGDGFGARIDASDPAVVYATSQNGNLGRVDMRTAATARVQRPRNARFNWDTPFILSPHNPGILYFAGNHLFRSVDRGAHSEQLTEDPLGLTQNGTATAVAESPVRAGLLYVGTDDGALWRSFDGGYTWREIHANASMLGGPRYVSSITPSHFEEERVYVTFDGHRSNDFDTYVLMSDDAGDHWRSLRANLPEQPCHVCREDPTRADLLYLGTEFGCYVSLDRGEQWFPVGSGLPTVAVRDLAIQNRDSDLVAATHGRGLWILDLAPLRQLTADVAVEPVHLFRPDDAILWRMRRRTLLGDRLWRADNPPYGAAIYLLLAEAPKEAPVVTIHDVTGREVASVRGEKRAGLQRLIWNVRLRPPDRQRDRERDGEPRHGRRSRRRSTPATPGAYAARLRVGDDEQVRAFSLRPDPDPSGSPAFTTTTTPGVR